MSIEMRAADVYALAHTLRGAASDADDIPARLTATPDVGSAVLRQAVDAFVDSHRAAGRAIAGELTWLGDTVAGVADSWLRLDGSLLGRHGGVTAG
jgi:hypothetical protein